MKTEMITINFNELFVGQLVFYVAENGDFIPGVVKRVFKSKIWLLVGEEIVKGIEQCFIPSESPIKAPPAAPPAPVAPAPEPEPEPEPQPEPVAVGVMQPLKLKLLPLDETGQPENPTTYIPHLREFLTAKKTAELLKFWNQIRPSKPKGWSGPFSFGPKTKEDLIGVIIKRLTIGAPEILPALFREWPNAVEKWRPAYWPWISQRQAFIVAELCNFYNSAPRWRQVNQAWLDQVWFDYGFFAGQFLDDYDNPRTLIGCIENERSWTFSPPQIEIPDTLGEIIKDAGEEWLRQVCDQELELVG